MGTLPALLTDPEVLLIGGGPIALQKARALHDNNIRFEVIASKICADLGALDIRTTERPVRQSDLKTADIIIDATGDPAVTELILNEKKERRFLFNSVSRPQLGDIYFPAILNFGDLKIAVSSNGASPTVSRIVRDRIAAMIPAGLSDLLARKKQERKRGIRDLEQTERECLELFATVYLIGCGPGDADLMTLKAYKTLQQMDVVLYDHLLTPEILDMIPEGAEKIFVGKKKGCHSAHQEQINDMLYQQARRGLKIARLKCGDPYVFGRGSEEAEYLIERGIRVETVSGISSALAGPACAGIPPTARGYATNMSIVSAHLAGCKVNTEWLPMLKIPHHTTIILMGVTFAEQISRMALDSGVDGAMPVAIVSNASRPDQEVRITDISGLPEAAVAAPRPAILVIGEVVNLHHKLSFAELPRQAVNG